MKTDVYNQEGKKTGNLELRKEFFGLPWNADLVHQVVVSMQANRRTNVAHAKTRAEVSGGGKKPWRQKGTGRARHGSTRSPIWVGGGVAHGPNRERDYSKKINKKMKKKALYVALSQKLRDGEILILDDLKISQPKTKEASLIMNSLASVEGFEKLKTKKKNTALLLVVKREAETQRAFRNLPGVLIDEARNLNPLQTLTYKYLIFPKESLKTFSKTS